MSERVRAVRGATQIDANEPDAIRVAVVELIGEILRQNDISLSGIISIVFSQTKDINRYNPATALRTAGYQGVPLFCTQEPEYDGATERMIRVLVTYSTQSDSEAIPVYLNGAENLRSDLFDR